ncbi:MAG: ABC transporter ATP-binding protein [Candidatus Accumulibacter sp.]|jgi:iron complex transport system ATP-binding protein|nr:ABC transporter ATP-binding protein [Accumulibacter sp.]
MSETPLLEARKLAVEIGGHSICRDFDFSLYPGDRLGILGCNGAGKSTLLSVLAGLRLPQAGEVLIDGKRYDTLGPRKSARIRGWLPQIHGDAFTATVLETALIGRHPHLGRWDWESEEDIRIARDALTAVGLAGIEQRDIQSLSGGERQRLAIAAMLAQSPCLFLLDEPIAYLDLKHQIAMLDLFSKAARENGAALVMVLHEPGMAWRYCSRVLMIHGDGTTTQGSAREMLTADRLSSLYSYPLELLENRGRVGFIPK